MSIQNSYNEWSKQYDSNENKTRDLEALSLSEILGERHFTKTLEIGCGTGKNTGMLAGISESVLSIDLSPGMIAVAKEKIKNTNVTFLEVDIQKDWDFAGEKFDLVTFSLVLEHIKDLESLFKKLSVVVNQGGIVYVGELHPVKQYSGSQARFETSSGTHLVDAFIHHVSDYTNAANDAGFAIESIREYFDGNDRTLMPRLITFLLRKK